MIPVCKHSPTQDQNPDQTPRSPAFMLQIQITWPQAPPPSSGDNEVRAASLCPRYANNPTSETHSVTPFCTNEDRNTRICLQEGARRRNDSRRDGGHKTWRFRPKAVWGGRIRPHECYQKCTLRSEKCFCGQFPMSLWFNVNPTDVYFIKSDPNLKACLKPSCTPVSAAGSWWWTQSFPHLTRMSTSASSCTGSKPWDDHRSASRGNGKMFEYKNQASN